MWDVATPQEYEYLIAEDGEDQYEHPRDIELCRRFSNSRLPVVTAPPLPWLDEASGEVSERLEDAGVTQTPTGAVHSDELVRAVRSITSRIAGMASDHERLAAIMSTLIRRLTDPTHLSVQEVAQIEGVSEKTVRNRIGRGKYELETVPGTRRCGIPIQQVFSRWIDIQVAGELLREVRDED
ncbi:MAG TPA: hypothetical protein VHL58_01525 [Thermoanaerobaculia bacterium]|nr:hypothetical protein [Thermoanaerobaculia bacterium]